MVKGESKTKGKAWSQRGQKGKETEKSIWERRQNVPNYAF
jgi:hypothetical protein